MGGTETSLLGKMHIKHGYAFKGEYFSSDGHHMVLTPGNFHEEGGFRVREGKEKFYSGEISEEYILKKGDLIVAMTEQGEGLLGSTAIIPEDNKYLHNQRIGLISVNEKELDKKFTYFLFNTSLIRQQIRNSSSGAKVRHTSPERIYNTKVELPGLPEQKKIAAILSAYDDLIENNKRRITLLEKMAEEIYREWFVRFRFPGYQQAGFEKGIPKEWNMVKLEKAFKFLGGGTPSKEKDSYWQDGKVNWYTPSDITGSKGIFLSESGDNPNEEGLQSCSAKLFPAYSVMMTSRATIGELGINTTEACTNQGFITCIPNEQYPLSFLFHWLKLSKDYFLSLCGGATFPELTKGTFKRIEIITPPMDIVDAFQELQKPLFKNIEILQSQNKNLEQTKTAILPRLISGKLSVEELDIQFPPSMQEGVAA